MLFTSVRLLASIAIFVVGGLIVLHTQRMSWRRGGSLDGMTLGGMQGLILGLTAWCIGGIWILP